MQKRGNAAGWGARGLWTAAGACAWLAFEEARAAVQCDGTELLCVSLSSRAEVEASGGVVVGGTFEGGGFRPANRGGIDWHFGADVDFSSGRVEFDLTGLRPTPGGDTDGGKPTLYGLQGRMPGDGEFLRLQKMPVHVGQGHLLRMIFDDEGGLEGGELDAIAITGAGSHCPVLSVASWGPTETHRIGGTWSRGGVKILVDGSYECGAAGKGDAFDPAEKTFTLGNRMEHPDQQHTVAVFRNLRLWASTSPPVLAPPVAQIVAITPTPAYREGGQVSFSGHARDGDENGGTIVAHEWRSNRDGLLGSSEDVLLQASELSPGSHVITFRAMDDEGVWAEQQWPLTVVDGAADQLTLWLPPTQDASIVRGGRGDPNANEGASEELRSGADGIGVADAAALLQFDLRPIAETVSQAFLHLACTNAGGGQVVLATSPLDADGQPWTEDGVTWNLAPAPITDVLDSLGSVAAGSPAVFDVSAVVRAASVLDVVVGSGSSDEARFGAREHPEPYTQPVLEVRFRPAFFRDGFEEGELDRWAGRVEP